MTQQLVAAVIEEAAAAKVGARTRWMHAHTHSNSAGQVRQFKGDFQKKIRKWCKSKKKLKSKQRTHLYNYQAIKVHMIGKSTQNNYIIQETVRSTW